MQVNMLEAKSQLSKLVKAAIAGEDVVIASHGQPQVRMVPCTAAPGLRQWGAWADQAVDVDTAFSAEADAQTLELFGKLSVDPVTFRDACLASGANLLPISDAHVIESGQLPDIHRDPFDRLLIAQARIEKCTAVSSDEHWDGYSIDLVRP